MSVDEIVAELAQYPNGIGEKYAGRLRRKSSARLRSGRRSANRSRRDRRERAGGAAVLGEARQERQAEADLHQRAPRIKGARYQVPLRRLSRPVSRRGKARSRKAAPISTTPSLVIAQQDPQGVRVRSRHQEHIRRRHAAVPRERIRSGPRLSRRADTGTARRGSTAGSSPTPAPTIPSSTANSAASRLIAAVRRARHPGIKFDPIIVLEGPMGTNKSKAIEILAGVENFSDQSIFGARDREQQELLAGVWLYEIAELSNIRKTEVEHIKAFASRTHDRARPAYGRVRVDQPRRCVLFATTNNDRYLKEADRRFWPVKTTNIDIEALKRDRDQLWAEAAQREREGASIVLRRELWEAARDRAGGAGRSRPVG